MGCGSSGQAVVPEAANGNLKANGRNGHGNDHNDDLPTVVLPDTPAKKPPIAFEIPLEEFDGNKRGSTPPPHLQRLLQPPQAEISLPDIEEKLAEAEQRRQTEFDGNKTGSTPPPHLQRLLQPPQAEISLPDIEEKLAEAEQRRQTILQQRAASAQKRSQKMMKSFSEMDQLDSEHDSMHMDGTKQTYKADAMKTETGRLEEPFSRKRDPMNVNSVMSDTSKHDYMTNNTHDDPRRKVLGSKHDPIPMGQNVDQMKNSAKRASTDNSKYGTNAVRIPPEPGVCEDKNI